MCMKNTFRTRYIQFIQVMNALLTASDYIISYPPDLLVRAVCRSFEALLPAWYEKIPAASQNTPTAVDP